MMENNKACFALEYKAPLREMPPARRERRYRLKITKLLSLLSRSLIKLLVFLKRNRRRLQRRKVLKFLRVLRQQIRLMRSPKAESLLSPLLRSGITLFDSPKKPAGSKTFPIFPGFGRLDGVARATK